MLGADGELLDVLTCVEELCGTSRALAAALVRAGALGAAVRLAQCFSGAHAETEREEIAMAASGRMYDVLGAVGQHLPEARADLQHPRLLQRRRALLC